MSAVAQSAPRAERANSLLRRTLWRPSSIALLALVVVGLLVPGLFPGQVPLMVTILGVLIFAYAWNPVGGMLGEMSLAHVIFWGGGAYSAILGINAGRPFVLCVVIGVAVAVVLGLATIQFAFLAKLDGLYLTVFTIVLVYFVQSIVLDSGYLGRDTGLTAIELPLSINTVYYVSVIVAAVLIVGNIALLATRRGLVWLAIRDEPDRVAALGWSTRKERRIAYVLTAALCSVGGSLSGAAAGFASPDSSLGIALIIVPLLAVYVGNPGTVWGPLFGVALLETFSSIASSSSTSSQAAETAQLLQYGIALVVVIFLMSRQRKRRMSAMVQSETALALADTVATGGGVARVLRGLRSRPARQELPAGRKAPAAAASGPLTVERLAKSFGALSVLKDVSFHVAPGEVLGLVGPNGAGKSTLCNLIAGLLEPDAGVVRLGERDARGVAPHRRVQLGLGRSYQSPRVFPSLTLAENVAIAGSAIGTMEAADALRELGVLAPDKLGATATLMERRMVEVARLVALRPRWILLDEPLAGLAASEHDHVLGLIKEMAGRGAAVLVIEHLVPVIAPITDRIVVLDGGRLIADGPPDEVLRQEEVVSAYLGAPVAVELQPQPGEAL
jgi:branched-chain amino acid transport system permease protein